MCPYRRSSIVITFDICTYFQSSTCTVAFAQLPRTCVQWYIHVLTQPWASMFKLIERCSSLRDRLSEDHQDWLMVVERCTNTSLERMSQLFVPPRAGDSALPRAHQQRPVVFGCSCMACLLCRNPWGAIAYAHQGIYKNPPRDNY